MDATLTTRDKARVLAADFAARATVHDRDASFPFANFQDLANAGLLALTVPRERGGIGAGAREAADVLGIIAYGDSSTALVLAMHYIQHASIARSLKWPSHLAHRLAKEATESVSLINALRVEPELGSPARGGLPATIAKRTPEGWRITGHKIYSTGSPILKWYLVWARTDEEPARVGSFLVPAGSAGARVVETWDHAGLRASGSHDVYLDNVLVPLDHEIDVRTIRQTREGLAILVPKSSTIKSFDDLKGKKIGTGRGSVGHQLLLAALEKHGLSVSDVQLVFLLPSDAKVAYSSGSIDAWSTWEPYTSQEEVLFGARRIVTGEGLTPGLSFLVSRPEPIRDKRAQLEDFIRRLTQARAWSQASANVANYAETWGKLMGIPKQVPLQWFQRAKIRIAPIEDSVVADEQSTIDLYYRTGLIKTKLDARDIVDTSFADAIAKGRDGLSQ